MNVCDRNLQQDQFEDQPIVRQFEMLFRKPFMGQFLFSLSSPQLQGNPGIFPGNLKTREPPWLRFGLKTMACFVQEFNPGPKSIGSYFPEILQ